MATFVFKLASNDDESIVDEISCTIEADNATQAESILRTKIFAAGELGFDLPYITQWLIWNQY